MWPGHGTAATSSRPPASCRAPTGASLGSVPRPPRPPIRARLRAAIATLSVVATVSCSGPVGATPRPTVADFEGLVQELHTRGVSVSDVRSGDPGCADPTLVGPAISFTAAGLDQPTPTVVRIYIFRNRDAYDRRRADVDTCAREFVTDPATFEAVDAPPFVAVGSGPWGARLREALRAALSAGSGVVSSPGPAASS